MFANDVYKAGRSCIRISSSYRIAESTRSSTLLLRLPGYPPGWNPRVGCGWGATGYGLAWVLHPGGYGYQHPNFGLPTGARGSAAGH
ncbi:hypothetical protein BDR05DRAFT_1005070 [Suillus weaverae]|nr:hypothetical protein BDR05DRAFT_1005070 [Suillus weaverae]